MAREYYLDFNADTKIVRKVKPFEYSDNGVFSNMLWLCLPMLKLLGVSTDIVENILVNKSHVKKHSKNWEYRKLFEKTKKEIVNVFTNLKLCEVV